MLLTTYLSNKNVGAPCTQTLMGLGAFPTSDPQFIGMLGMHGTYEANMSMHQCDLMLCVGARFDDRITGKVSGFHQNQKRFILILMLLHLIKVSMLI